jgi:hypothetical protein
VANQKNGMLFTHTHTHIVPSVLVTLFDEGGKVQMA